MTSFTTPTPIESAHDFLWRVHRKVPPQGCIGIFNRSHYEDVLITHVHGMISGRRVEEQVDRINAFEELLRRSGMTEKDGQRERRGHAHRHQHGLRAVAWRADEPEMVSQPGGR